MKTQAFFVGLKISQEMEEVIECTMNLSSYTKKHNTTIDDSLTMY